MERGDWMASRSIAVQGVNFTADQPPVMSCGYFLNFTSENPVLMSGVSQHTSEALFSRTLPLNVPYWNLTFYDRTIMFPELRDVWPIADFLMSFLPNKTAVYAGVKPLCSECVFQWCVKTITAKSVSGVFSDEVQSTWTNNTPIPNPIMYSWSDGGLNSDPRFEQILTPPDGNETFMPQMNSSVQLTLGFKSFLPMYYTFTTDSAESVPQVQTDNLPWGGGEYITDLYPIDLNRSSVMTVQNLTDFMDSIATILTDTIRSYPNSSEPVEGYGGVESIISIQWAWIVLPVLVLLLTYIGVSLTICRSPSRCDGGIWKTSLLASIIHGMIPDTREQLGKAWTLTDILKKSSTVRVSMKADDNGYSFLKS
jgi:hypothetical protein